MLHMVNYMNLGANFAYPGSIARLNLARGSTPAMRLEHM
jgi:hypothetical protein